MSFHGRRGNHENVRLGDGYREDKHLSRVSLTCIIMRTHWLDIFLLNSWTHNTHTAMIWYNLLPHWWSASWCIVPWIFEISWYRIVAKSLYRDIANHNSQLLKPVSHHVPGTESTNTISAIILLSNAFYLRRTQSMNLFCWLACSFSTDVSALSNGQEF